MIEPGEGEGRKKGWEREGRESGSGKGRAKRRLSKTQEKEVPGEEEGRSDGMEQDVKDS